MMKFKSSYDLLLYYFQDILDINDLQQPTESNEAIINEICGDYKNSFGALREYSNENIWKIIQRKFQEEFDELLYERTRENK